MEKLQPAVPHPLSGTKKADVRTLEEVDNRFAEAELAAAEGSNLDQAALAANLAKYAGEINGGIVKTATPMPSIVAEKHLETEVK